MVQSHGLERAMKVIASRVFMALQRETNNEAVKLCADLGGSINDMMRALPQDAYRALVGGDATSDQGKLVFALTTLGYLMFAQEVLSAQCSNRVDDATLATLRTRTYKKYLRVLLKKERSLEECSGVLKVRIRTVKKRLGELSQMGAVGFRNEGKGALYFLTPFGISLND
jgi:hypothetical protein